MGFRFRKSFGKGPFRVTISKSGISTSVGVKGARITKTASGKTQATVGIPGTGISHTTNLSRVKKAEHAQPAPTKVTAGHAEDRPDIAVAADTESDKMANVLKWVFIGLIVLGVVIVVFGT